MGGDVHSHVASYVAGQVAPGEGELLGHDGESESGAPVGDWAFSSGSRDGVRVLGEVKGEEEIAKGLRHCLSLG